MHKKLLHIILLALFISSTAYAAPLQPGENFPDIPLKGELTAKQKTYLGLKGDGPWKTSDIEDTYIIIEVYSMYCPHCQKEAPTMNAFYRLLSKSDKFADIKFFGLASGNSQFEVDFFRKKFSVKFPLFTDEDLDLHSKVGAPGTPHFFMLRKKGESLQIILSHAGPYATAEEFLKDIKDKI
ncbi:TlpA disulfide reductase family protein [Maridesulfovibrio sp.]|uniref:peroxiredoxin family protein n=1 Tax=Maridesulfovibrio sp. TaxID=2795000 RepID=UPI0029C9FD15|nr:TlpA disulfide reductase family protein [Maridesulfovibrio sp.]